VAERVEADKLRDLQRVTDAALATLPLDRLLTELLDRVVEILDVDTAAILLLEDDGRTLVARAAKGLDEEVRRGVRVPVRMGFAGRIAATGQPVFIADLDKAEVVNPLLRERGLKSLLGVPLMVEGEVIGVLHIGTLQPRLFDDDDVELLQSAGDRAALAINGRLTEQERGLADALQRSLIPRLPELPGLSLDARYLPAAEAKLGGDWYDAFVVAGGKLALAIGDVSGRGFHAAALMGQLRSGLRACAMDELSPARVAERVSRLLRQLEPSRTATLLYLVLDPAAGSITAMSAGHPPPLAIHGDGRCEYVLTATGVPLGAVRQPRYTDVEAQLEPGATLLLYTDGLVEKPGEPLDVGFVRLLEAAAAVPPGATSVCQLVVETMLPGGALRDDAALLTVRADPLTNPLQLTFPARMDAIPVLRRVLGRWLGAAGASRRDIEDISLACSEACANSIEHAYAPGPATLELSASVSADGQAEVSVRDFGRWRDARGTHRGRGTVLMRGLMDVVEIDPGDGGTTVRLVRRLERDAA
jgi:anti-sigma regulatory factor (Ser/Thr protein kinase)/putative methionine-R-sulfoxide reductase with GAF domain